MGELKAKYEAMKLELESSHAEQLQCVKEQYEMSLEGEWTVPDHYWSYVHSLKLHYVSLFECFGCILTSDNSTSLNKCVYEFYRILTWRCDQP